MKDFWSRIPYSEKISRKSEIQNIHICVVKVFLLHNCFESGKKVDGPVKKSGENVSASA